MALISLLIKCVIVSVKGQLQLILLAADFISQFININPIIAFKFMSFYIHSTKYQMVKSVSLACD